jgi:hypothetical protein
LKRDSDSKKNVSQGVSSAGKPVQSQVQSQQAGQLVSQGQAQIPQQPQMSAQGRGKAVRRPRSNRLKIVNPDLFMEEINAAAAAAAVVVSNHLFDGLELSNHLKSLFSKQGIEDCFLFFNYCIGLMCRFVAFMLLKYQVHPSQTSKVINNMIIQIRHLECKMTKICL